MCNQCVQFSGSRLEAHPSYRERNARGRDFSLIINTKADSFEDFFITDSDQLMKNIANFKKELEQSTARERS